MRIGVLAVQGAFAEHESMLDRLDQEHFQIRKPSDLEKNMDGLIIPGGESTVIGKLLTDLGMLDDIRQRIIDGLPVFGTCAGLILLSDTIINDDRRYLGTFPMSVRRNAFGRQLGSFFTVSNFDDLGMIPMEFIRAPVIESVGEGVTILSVYNGKIVAARFKNQLVTAFHPELTDDLKVHRYFLSLINNI
ncbi:MAG: pyridoxal 5'-phosphate synthase glutaminase subunit PdxT [Candidatus Methanogranum gryphiswaldense]|nr:MAG: pyridoxal 5'-phosphate synthase glutaminase subunit PdxT [Candidatus Methanogranum sp. U3.2.1]